MKKTPEGRVIGTWKRVGKDMVLKGWFSGKKMSFFIPPGDCRDAVFSVVDSKKADPYRAKR